MSEFMQDTVLLKWEVSNVRVEKGSGKIRTCAPVSTWTAHYLSLKHRDPASTMQQGCALVLSSTIFFYHVWAGAQAIETSLAVIIYWVQKSLSHCAVVFKVLYANKLYLCYLYISDLLWCVSGIILYHWLPNFVVSEPPGVQMLSIQKFSLACYVSIDICHLGTENRENFKTVFILTQ